MKFITSTDLKQWAYSNECKQLLPGLIKRLIDTSVSNVDKISFPSGDATFLPGWDGIVSCNESIDIIPAGISLWECGATNDVSGKINHDFKKRDENPLGYDKKESTFVFVTPRIWEGAEEWIQTHGEGWKKVVVYTAIELDRWIDNNPSVGMWLAEILHKLPSSGYKHPKLYWDRWAQGELFKLPYGIILHGRTNIQNKVIETCTNGGTIVLQTLTQDEGIAFAIASLIENKNDVLTDKIIVATEKNAFEDLVEHYNNLIIITTITEGVHYSNKCGHTIIIISTPADGVKGAIQLPRIEKEGFIASVVGMGIDEAKARAYATDTARDINIFRRRIGIAIEKPKWGNSIVDLFPAIMVGKWNDSCPGDKEIIKKLAGMEYGEFELSLSKHVEEEDSPLLHIAHFWRMQSPYEAIEYTLRSKHIPCSFFDTYRDICLELIKDDDVEAVEELEKSEFYFHKYNQKYSNAIKEGVFQNLCLLSVLDNSENKEIAQWVDNTIALMLKDWSLARFLSNRHFLTSLAEASPNSFLNYVEHIPQEQLDNVFLPRKKVLSLSEWNISYTELLWALELLAWDAEYLNRVTRLLLNFTEYANDSNYENRPINSLYNIFRFFLPQTYVPFGDRMTILESLAPKYKKSIFILCKRICESLNAGNILAPSVHFKWRMFGMLETPKSCLYPTLSELNRIIDLMLQSCDYNGDSIAELITISSNANMGAVRTTFLNAIKQHLDEVDDKQIIIDTLRKDITKHKQCEGDRWALSEMELKPYQELFDAIEPKDVLLKHAWLFDDYYAQIPYKRCHDYREKYEEQEKVRLEALREIVQNKGEKSLWDFVQIVKFPESMARSIVSLFDDKLTDEVLEKYKLGKLNESFTKSYLTALYNKDVQRYLNWAKGFVLEEDNLSIVLYAPGYTATLADIAERSKEIKRCYWENVQVGIWTKTESERVVRELKNVNRYSEAIEIISSDRENIQIPDIEVVEVLYDYITKGTVQNRHPDMYYISLILEKLDKSEDPNVIKPLVFIEFVLFRQLEHRLDTNELRLSKELSRSPELMMQLVELADLPDDRDVEKLEGTPLENKKLLSTCAFHILYFGHNIVSFYNEEGVLDGDYMKQYIEQLLKLAKERKRTNAIDHIIGGILGDIPRDENYPPTALCEILENLNNDKVDDSLRTRIYNSRGVSVRACNEGGEQERSIVSRFEAYKEKTKLLYTRMTRIFDCLINDYKREAGEIDNEALITDLEY